MGCTSSSAVKEPQSRKRNGDDPSTARSGSDRKANRHNSMYTNYAEPALSQGGEENKKRIDSMDNLAAISMAHIPSKEDIIEPESMSDIANVEEKQAPEEGNGEISTLPPPERTNSKGSIIRNGVYYSESELAEEGVTWQPKYWTPERIGKWVEDTEYPDGVKFSEIRKTVLQGATQGGGKKSPRSTRKSRPSSNSVG